MNAKLSQYADDGTLFLSDEFQIQAAIKGIMNLQNYLERAVGMFLGIDKNRTVSVCGIQFSCAPIKCLGIYVGYDRRLCEEINWQDKLDSIPRLLRSWKGWKITV